MSEDPKNDPAYWIPKPKKKKVEEPVESIAEILAEGEREIEKEEAAKAAAKHLLTPAQRYELAHHQILNDLPRLKRESVERCIKNKDYDNKDYIDFTREVIKLAESNEPSNKQTSQS